METTARALILQSHQDEPWEERVGKHLGVLAGARLAVWNDRRIAAEADWREEIDRAIAECDVALLLEVSADFLTSRVIPGTAVPTFLKRRREQGLGTIPLVSCPCA
jgi:hypothetical protein